MYVLAFAASACTPRNSAAGMRAFRSIHSVFDVHPHPQPQALPTGTLVCRTHTHTSPPLALNLSPLLSPIQPTPRVLTHPRPPSIGSQPGRRAAAHAGAAVHDHLGVARRPREAEPVLELLLADVEAVRRRRHGDVDCARDSAGGLEFVGLADVYEPVGGEVSEGCALGVGRSRVMAYR